MDSSSDVTDVPYWNWDPAANLRVVPRNEGPGRASYHLYDGPLFRGWSTINCGPDQMIARAFVEDRALLRAKASYLYPSDPDWVVQEAVGLATERAHKLRQHVSPTSFVAGFIPYVVIGRHRARRTKSLTDVAERDTPTVQPPPLELPDDEQARRQLALRLIAELPRSERDAVLLVDMLDLSLSEAALRLHKTADAVSSARRRGRKRLGLPPERA